MRKKFQGSEEDQSAVLVVPEKEVSSCPECFEEIFVHQIRQHLQSDCRARLVTPFHPTFLSTHPLPIILGYL